MCWGLTTRQPLRVILCRLPATGRKEIEEIVEEMKERDREERGKGMKVKKQNKNMLDISCELSANSHEMPDLIFLE